MPRSSAAPPRPAAAAARSAAASTSTTTSCPAGVNRRSTRSRSVPSASSSRPWISTISTPRRAVNGARRTAERTDLARRQVDRGPDVQDDAVPLQPAARLDGGPGSRGSPRAPARTSARGRAARRPPVGVAQRGEVAHLREREQPLVLRVRCARCRGTGRRPPRRAIGPARTPTAGRGARRYDIIGCRPRSTLSSTRPPAPGRKVSGVMADSTRPVPGAAAPTTTRCTHEGIATPASSARTRSASPAAPVATSTRE